MTKDNSDEEKQKLSIFSFPKDQEIRRKWIRAIPRDNWEPTSNSGVCQHHFKPDDFVLYRTDTMNVGKTKKQL